MDIGIALQYFLVGFAGYLLGFLTNVGYAKWKGRKIIAPFISHSARNMTLFAIILGILSLFTLVQVQRNADEADECAVEFRTALKYNQDLTTQLLKLDDQERAVTAQAREDLAQWTGAISVIDPADQTGIRAAARVFNEQRAATDAQLDAIQAEREALEETRAPYPDPQCGR